ncbi:AraC family transcriptional regulator [Pelagibacterium halotolerans]|uniref:Transcriptional regulator, AraC family n=1 Tax=Pelagibacterium halotolerans (strain DSM 22347 / JCM 15775 / CGMCC 1.7692 / B2) TaxID=1082931 RepID=G4R735_PELHB|nr:transcriptional regulator, AraC family [Pelagibacterium halotolerans B2]SEA50157.1 AraC family transcriptional regulator [Pelagibacterium halotolerans]
MSGLEFSYSPMRRSTRHGIGAVALPMPMTIARLGQTIVASAGVVGRTEWFDHLGLDEGKARQKAGTTDDRGCWLIWSDAQLESGGPLTISVAAGVNSAQDLPFDTGEPVSFVYLNRPTVLGVTSELISGLPGEMAIRPGRVENDCVLQKMISVVHSILDARDGGGAQIAFLTHLLRAMAAHLVSTNSDAPERKAAYALSADDAAFAKATEYMLENIERPISVQEIASMAGVGPYKLGRIFKSAINDSPYNYFVKLRIERAKRLLSLSNLPISHIALECGFSHQEHLTRRFREHCGTTPAVYRRQRKIRSL